MNHIVIFSAITDFPTASQGIITMSLLQVQQLLHYGNHGDLFGCDSQWKRIYGGEWVEDERVCVCACVHTFVCLHWQYCASQIN